MTFLPDYVCHTHLQVCMIFKCFFYMVKISVADPINFIRFRIRGSGFQNPYTDPNPGDPKRPDPTDPDPDPT